ncbi:DMT family transporter [Ancylobacter mangrovi]|uniref:DMT family transporter n=1 Tax=Ancylobacter mangrovi TaxID=2972472 RepID=UPI002162B69B|nr:DMT family transporter [Ancylobacter mangrovi]MCS0501738.1 DMT family transporter [Ancylobacter mangrovi]
MLIGILGGLLTGATWGLSFVAPRAIAPVSAFDFSVVRYLLFGLVSLLLMAAPRFRPSGMTTRQLVLGGALGAFGYFGYFLAISYAVLFAGAVLPPLITGTAPVLLAVVANLRERTVAWRSIALPLALIVAGLVLVNAHDLRAAAPDEADAVLAGAALSLLALGIWILYGLANAAALRAAAAPDALRWTGLQGLGAGAAAVALMPFGLDAGLLGHDREVTTRFLAWALGMGVVASWLGTYGWVVASQRLPLALSAQLIVAETVFGLGYGLAFEQRWPSAAETAGAALQLVGVVAAVAIFSRRRLTPEPGIP